MYNVTATETGLAFAGNRSLGAWSCSIVDHSSAGHNVSPVRAGEAHVAGGFSADTAGTGAVFGGPASPIELICGLASGAVSVAVNQADLTAVRVSSVNGVAVTGKPAHRPIMNHFVRPQRGLPAARATRSQAPR
jgi:hypothetical protein